MNTPTREDVDNMQTKEEVLEMLRLASLTDEFIPTMMNWADRPQFPLYDALCQCGEGELIVEDLSYDPPSRESIRASEVVKMIISPFFVTEVKSSEVRLTRPADARFFEEGLGLARYYVVFLIAKLWALKHAPTADEKGMEHLAKVWDLEHYLKELPNQDEVDADKLIELCEGAGYPDKLQGRLQPGQIPVEYHLSGIIDGALRRTVKLTVTGNYLDIEWLKGSHEPGGIDGCPWVSLVRPLEAWLDKHPDFPKGSSGE